MPVFDIAQDKAEPLIMRFLESKHCQMLSVPSIITDDKERADFAQWLITFLNELFDFAAAEQALPDE